MYFALATIRECSKVFDLWLKLISASVTPSFKKPEKKFLSLQKPTLMTPMTLIYALNYKTFGICDIFTIQNQPFIKDKKFFYQS